MKKILLFSALTLGIISTNLVSCGEATIEKLKSIELISKEGNIIPLNKEIELTVKTSPSDITNLNENLTFSSSDKNIISVRANGKIIGHKIGKATITVKTTNGLTDSLELEVANLIDLPKNAAEVRDLLLNATSFNHLIKEESFITEATKNHELNSYSLKRYNDEVLISAKEKYDNPRNPNEAIIYNYEDLSIIKDNYYQNVILVDEISNYGKSSAIRYPIKDYSDKYQYTLEEAKAKLKEKGFIGTFSTTEFEVFDNANKNIKINSIEEDNIYKIDASSEYIFKWAETEDCEYRTYSAHLEFDKYGKLLKASTKNVQYDNFSYDYETGELYDDVNIENIEESELIITYGDNFEGNSNINVNDYFVNEILEITLNKELKIGDFVTPNSFIISKYAPNTSLDSTNFVIKDIINPVDKEVISITNFGYKVANNGKAKIIFQMGYTPNVIFELEIEIK